MQNGSRAVVRSRAARDERSVIQTLPRALGRDTQNGARPAPRSRAARDERSVIQTVLAGSRDERSVIQTVPRYIYFSSEGSSKEQGCQG